MNTGIFRSLRVLVTATALAGAFCTAFAQTQAYPSRPVKLVVPAAAGTAMDTTGRLIAEELKAAFNQAVIVENRLGAQLIIGTEYVAKSPPDGYTLVLGSNTSHSSNPYLFKRIGYDPIKDFAPVSGLMTLPVVVVVNPKLPVNSMQELLDYVRSRPGKTSYGYGNSISHLTGAAIAKASGGDPTATPYKSTPQTLTDLVGGQIDFAAIDTASVKPFLTSGRLRALAVSSAARTSLVPGVPAMAETPALGGYELIAWIGLFAPAGTPADIVNQLSVEVRKALAKPAISERLAGFGAEVTPFNPQELDKFTRAQLEFWGKRIREAGLQPE
jgi:tripartite-type tricarboxylate transporter receptor subunit TctC